MMKKNRNYKQGRDFEYTVKRHLEDFGWTVRRAYASKGIFDLLAYNKRYSPLGIQVKSLTKNNNRAYLDPKERADLTNYVLKPQVPYEFVSWNKKYNFPLLELLDDIFTVVHAYNKFPLIGFKKYVFETGWRNVYIAKDISYV